MRLKNRWRFFSVDDFFPSTILFCVFFKTNDSSTIFKKSLDHLLKIVGRFFKNHWKTKFSLFQINFQDFFYSLEFLRRDWCFLVQCMARDLEPPFIPLKYHKQKNFLIFFDFSLFFTFFQEIFYSLEFLRRHWCFLVQCMARD